MVIGSSQSFSAAVEKMIRNQPHGFQALQELLGHRNIRTTMIYKHLTPAHLLQEADRVTLE